jgi:hypothetical protein
MNIKELSEFLGVSEKTIKRICNKNGILFNHGIKKIFNKSEVEAISLHIYKKMPMAIKDSIDVTFNTDRTNVLSTDRTNVLSNESLTQELIKSFNVLVQTVNNLSKIITEDKKQNKLLLPEPPIKNYREALNQFIRSYADKKKIVHSFLWSKLYNEAYYRLNINMRVCASNRGMSIMDYAEQEGHLPNLLSIAKDIFI